MVVRRRVGVVRHPRHPDCRYRIDRLAPMASQQRCKEAQPTQERLTQPNRDPMRVCSTPGCPAIYPRSEGSRCQAHRRAADKARGSATDRGYASRGHRSFRNQVLQQTPICCLCSLREATVADHYPISRRDLVEFGMDPNDPSRGRGLCGPCHSRETAKNPDQAGGWNARPTD